MDVNEKNVSLQPQTDENCSNQDGAVLQTQSEEEFFEGAPKQTKLTEAPFHFPESDVDKHGNLKPVRGRVLKKLLKYEFKALYAGMLILIISLLACSILLSLQIWLYSKDTPKTAFASGNSSWFFILTIALTGCLGGSMMIGSLMLPSRRYRKNFFKDEGYLTFSIPATAHEQILAKHISSILCIVAGAITSLLALIIICAGSGMEGIFTPSVGTTKPMQPSEIVENVLIVIEILTLVVITPVVLTTMDGAFAWIEQSLPEKHRQLYVGLIILGVISLFETLFISFALNGVTQEFFRMPITLILLIFIVIGLAIIVGCYCYEIHCFKNKINLK